MRRSFMFFGQNWGKKVSGVVLFSFLVNFLFPPVVLAANTDLLSTVAVEANANHTITLTATTDVAAAGNFVITFPADFALTSVDYTDIDLKIATVETTLAADATGATWGVAVNAETRTITFTSDSGTVTENDVLEIQIGSNATSGATGDQLINNPTTPGTYAVTWTSGAETVTISVVIVSDDSVAISATVNQTFSFAISDTEIGFGSLSTTKTRYATSNATGADSEEAAHTITAATNAATGYSISVQGTTLTSGLNNIDTIGLTATATSTGVEQFGLRVSASGGSGTASAPYDDTKDYAFAATANAADEIAAAGAPTASTVFSIYYAANIAATTNPGTYTTTLTFIATANY